MRRTNCHQQTKHWYGFCDVGSGKMLSPNNLLKTSLEILNYNRAEIYLINIWVGMIDMTDQNCF